MRRTIARQKASQRTDEAFLRGQAGEDRGLGLIEMSRQDPRRGRRVPHFVADRVDRRRLDGDRERPSFAIEDRSAQRRHFDSSLLLALRAGPVMAAFRDLELGETADDDRSPERKKDGEEPNAAETNEVHRSPLSRCSTYWICPGRGGASPLRIATDWTRSGEEARASSARRRRFSSKSSACFRVRAPRT